MTGKITGNRAATRTAIADCLGAVRRMVGAHVGNQQAAMDLVQEACAQMLARPDLQGIRNPGAYLYRAAVNIAYNATARYRREAIAMETLAVHVEQAVDARDPARIYDDRKALQRVSEAIDALPPRCREVFILYRFHDLDQGTIASQLGISRNMVEKHVIRAMQACREALADDA
ncbi:ECF sigma factor [Bordetella ansorpii]|uniref:ECF sigma factor n=1 Tax=Bordetella ansorpii TaxID=288768 RepID=A0A157PIW2_9BORD|nr:RNA polymerase sigma factor [Bordetella ansorpii]SAI33326.1 ECF sigma factor [Bordetella ansorpii]